MQEIRNNENRKEKDNIKQKESLHKTEERKEEIKEKVSFLTAFFEGKDRSSTPKDLNTPIRRSRKKGQRKIMEIKNQMRIDTFLMEGGKEKGGKSTPAKRKRQEEENVLLGTLTTPQKIRRRDEAN